jgi:uncharacterized membrane protein AbrB (regulator of aidB expression)
LKPIEIIMLLVVFCLPATLACFFVDWRFALFMTAALAVVGGGMFLVLRVAERHERDRHQ